MEQNQNANSYKSFYRMQAESFPKQLKTVLTKEQYAQYNLLISVWKRVGANTTISVYPIFQVLSNLFSGIQWCGKYGGLKTAYEFYVPDKFTTEYRKAMFGENALSATPIEVEIKRSVQKIDQMAESQLEDMTSNANTLIFLREKLFYHLFSLSIIDDIPECQRKWESSSERVRRILCFDLNSVAEMASFLEIKAEDILNSLGDKTAWPITSRKKKHVESEEDAKKSVSGDLESFEEDSIDLELDESVINEDSELQDNLRKFEEEVLGLKITFSGEKEDFVRRERVATPIKEDSVSLQTTERPKKKKTRKKKKGKKSMWSKENEKDIVAGEELLKIIPVRQRPHRGPLLIHSDEEPPLEEAPYLQNFNQADFVPDAPDDTNASQSSYGFLQRYNATNASSNPGLSSSPDSKSIKGAENESGVPAKGFYDSVELQRYREKVENATERGEETPQSNKKGSDDFNLSNADLKNFGRPSSKRIDEEPPKNESEEEFSEGDWMESLRRNEKIRAVFIFQKIHG